MKKIILIVLGLWLMTGLVQAKGFRIEVKGSCFSSENEIFRDVYGAGAKFGLEGGVDIVKNVSLWVGLDYLRKNGELTESKEETRVWLTPLTLGVRYEIPAGNKLRFHVGAGIQEVFFKEDSILGTVKENALGFIAKGGGMYQLANHVSAGLFLAWSTCKMTHEEVEFKVGGLDLGAGVEIRF